MPNLAQRLTAEFVGTFALVFVGVIAISHGGLAPGGELVTVALAFGLTIAVMVAALGAVSGAQFNPAVSIALLALGRMSAADALAYILAQIAGASAASYLLLRLFGIEGIAPGVCTLAPGLGPVQGAVLEALGTGLLMLVVCGVVLDERGPKQLAPLLIGLTITADICGIGPLTGAALNPARALGPALAAGQWDAQWVFWAGPIVGALLFGLLQQKLLAGKKPA
jgi:aquaporin Z